MLTPPDVVSQLALAIPMCLLYEVGIWAAVIFIKHTQPPAEEKAASVGRAAARGPLRGATAGPAAPSAAAPRSP